MVDHRDADEWNYSPKNLRWLCKACNTRLGIAAARADQGRRTRQYNPRNPGAENLAQYVQAALDHRRGEHDAGGKIIHETPKSKRTEFAEEIWRRRRRHGTDRRFVKLRHGRWQPCAKRQAATEG